jgi:hypothetical protein
MKMRTLRPLVLLLVLASCGGSSGGGSTAPDSTTSDDDNTSSCITDPNVVGTWSNLSINETLTVNSNCTITSDFCGSTLVVPSSTSVVNGLAVTIKVIVASTNGTAGCLSVGQHDCIYSVSTTETSGKTDNLLSWKCTGSSTQSYKKQ